MTLVTWLTQELASAPDNELLAYWLVTELVEERDMIASEARRHVADVQQLGRDCAELLNAVRPVPLDRCKINRRSR